MIECYVLDEIAQITKGVTTFLVVSVYSFNEGSGDSIFLIEVVLSVLIGV
ncbi:hypothetical protein VCO01S_23890 [Vibrio comitans NBRC 102076]|uniref:Uncharacterized protein n=1 Tax=Vibrio comitans NBRC 102076 TaxID=1219078 RepID=A0A4Y3IPA0_9VIBR|nr:hypothetical protein VCO01S_23890 [Vibrio comitans NBRC 102076]